jgi:SAM-dependent methyltransferase
MSSSVKYPGLENQPSDNASDSRLVQTIRRLLRTQFGRPAGFLGSVAGSIMAHTPSNLDRIQWTISLLELKPNDRVLEVGFGPGQAIQLASKIAVSGFVAGIDHSEEMVRQATKRNGEAIRRGRVRLQLGSASNPPPFDGLFDKIFTINSIHFWTNPVECLEKLRKLLRPGGRIAVTMQPRSRAATDAATVKIGEEIAANLERAGFSGCRVEIRKNSTAVACVVATH